MPSVDRFSEAAHLTFASKPSDSELLDLVGEIYDCAIEPARWPNTLERIARRVGGNCAVIALSPRGKRGFALKAQWNVNPDHEQTLRENFAENPSLPSLWYYDVDDTFTAYDFCGPQYVEGGWHRRVQAPYGYGDTALAFLSKSDRHFGSIAIMRDLHLGGFCSESMAELRALVPHVRRAAMIADLLEARTLARDTLAATLDLMNAGVVLTEADGRIVHANAAAERQIESRNALRRDGAQLTAPDSQSAAELRLAIGFAASGTKLEVPKSGITVVLKATDGHDLAAWVLPLDRGLRRDLSAGVAARAAVFIRELGDTAPIPAELFVRRYAITAAECRVLVLIVQGMTIAETAESLGISVATAKTHLIGLFRKTGTQRQSDLVRVAMSALAPASTK
jgi:DNA-binding CsgD family transcriptional regulator